MNATWYLILRGRVPLHESSAPPRGANPFHPSISSSQSQNYKYLDLGCKPNSDIKPWNYQSKMEAAISQPKPIIPCQFCASTPKIGGFRPNVSMGQRRNNWFGKVNLKCAKGDRVVVEDDDEDEMNVEEELKEVSRRCRGAGGIVELMECLEREAIMGEDEGREASDYNRRALIFDRSSRVFQALKHQSQTQTTTSASSCE